MSDQQTFVGVVALDPLRLVGLQAILEESEGVVARAIRIEAAMVSTDLAAVLLDSACVPDLPATLLRFRRELPLVRVIVLGDGLGPEQIEAVLAAGARGYLSESASEDEIREAVAAVLRGELWAPEPVLDMLFESGVVVGQPEDGGTRLSDTMTRRELELLGLLKVGKTNREIGEALGIEPVTVKAHVGRMMRKAGVKNRIELTLRAIAEDPGGP